MVSSSWLPFLLSRSCSLKVVKKLTLIDEICDAGDCRSVCNVADGKLTEGLG